MNPSYLRILAKDYAERRIDRKAYILERRRIIDGVVAGTVELMPARPEPHPETPFEKTQALPPYRAPKRLPVWLAWLALFMLLGLVAAWWWQTRPVLPAPALAPPADVRAGQLLAAFLASNQWSDAAIAVLAAAWQGASAAERAAAADGVALRRMNDAIHGKIIEGKALLALGDARVVLSSQRRLLDLAALLGLGDARFQQAEAEWQAAWAALNATPPAGAAPAAPERRIPPAAADLIGSGVPAKPAPADAPAALPDVPAADAAVIPAPAAAGAMPPAHLPADTAAPITPPATAAPSTPAPATPVPAATPPRPAPEAGATKRGEPSGGCRADLARNRRPYCRDRLADGAPGPIMVVLPAGRFRMGGSEPEEQPRREIVFPRAFAIGIFELSAAELANFCQAVQRACPAQPWTEPGMPAVNVSWDLAAAYADWLSQATGARYRLPTEAEWEYAARGGTETEFPFGEEILPTHARFSYLQRESAPLAANDRAVNKNRFRLYHMVGNVREWVQDGWAPDYADAPADGSAAAARNDRVVRGGSYADPAAALRSAARGHALPLPGDPMTGFRLVREIP